MLQRLINQWESAGAAGEVQTVLSSSSLASKSMLICVLLPGTSQEAFILELCVCPSLQHLLCRWSFVFACSSGPTWCPELLPTVWGCPPAGSRFNESQLEQQEPVKKLPHPPNTPFKCTLCFTPRPPGYQSISCAAIMSEMYESMAWVWWNSCFVQIL